MQHRYVHHLHFFRRAVCRQAPNLVVGRRFVIAVFALIVLGSQGIPRYMLYAQQQKPPERIRSLLADSLTQVLSGNLSDSVRVNVLVDLARELWASNLEESRTIANDALRLAERLGYGKGTANALNTIGVTYYYQGWYDIALGYHQKSLALRKNLNDTAGIGHSTNNIGLIYMGQRKHTEALTYLYEALQIYKSIPRRNSAAAVYNNIGTIYRRQKNLDSAAAMHQIALTMLQGTNNRAGLALSYNSMGAVLEDAGNHTEALLYQRQALALYEEIRNHKGIVNALYSAASVLSVMKRHSEALVDLRRAIDLATAMNSRPELRDCYQLLSQIEEATGEIQAALFNYKRFEALKDSLVSEEAAARSAEFNAKYDTERKAKQIELLTALRERQFLERNLLLALVAVSLMAVALLYTRYRIKRKSEQALQNANVQLQEMDTEKNEFLGIVAHDLKNPLSGIHGLVYILEDSAESPDAVRQVAKIILKSTEKMLELVKNLLDVNQLELGSRKYEMQLLNVAWVLMPVVESYMGLAEDKNIVIDFTPPDEHPVICYADQTALSQVLDNLVSNAVKFSLPETSIHIVILEKPNSIAISIRDEGPGLTDEDKLKLFGKFARLSAQPTGGEHSTGLGLSIVKKMVDSMNGKVWCESVPGEGATFLVEFPRTELHT